MDRYAIWADAWRDERSCCLLLSKVVRPPALCPCKPKSEWGYSEKHGAFYCKACKRRISVKWLTFFRGRGIPLPLWFEALWQFASARAEDQTLTAKELHEAVIPRAKELGLEFSIKAAKGIMVFFNLRLPIFVFQSLVWRGFKFGINAGASLTFQNGAIVHGSKILFPKEMTDAQTEKWRQAVADNRRGYARANKSRPMTKKAKKRQEEIQDWTVWATHQIMTEERMKNGMSREDAAYEAAKVLEKRGLVTIEE